MSTVFTASSPIGCSYNSILKYNWCPRTVPFCLTTTGNTHILSPFNGTKQSIIHSQSFYDKLKSLFLFYYEKDRPLILIHVRILQIWHCLSVFQRTVLWLKRMRDSVMPLCSRRSVWPVSPIVSGSFVYTALYLAIWYI